MSMSSDRPDIPVLRRDFAAFLRGGEKVHRFGLRSEPQSLIRDIYSVVFPGWRLPAFYLRFTLARLAERIDLSVVKVPLYRLLGVRIGRGAFLAADVILDPHFPELIEIGDHAIIGWGAKLFTHEWFGGIYRAGRIKVGRGAVIGAYAVLRGGVEIGDGAEVGAMSVVCRDVPPGVRLVNKELMQQVCVK